VFCYLFIIYNLSRSPVQSTSSQHQRRSPSRQSSKERRRDYRSRRRSRVFISIYLFIVIYLGSRSNSRDRYGSRSYRRRSPSNERYSRGRYGSSRRCVCVMQFPKLMNEIVNMIRLNISFNRLFYKSVKTLN
jgi:hypothetical protein